jgi:hypothetical protein
MVTTTIPPRGIYLPVSLRFTGLFNTPEIGRYSFNTALNTGREVLKFQANAWYFIDAVAIGGTISELDYCNSIDRIPTLILKKSITGERVYTLPLTIPKYAESRAMCVYCNSDKGYRDNPDKLTADFEGSLNQIAATVGLPSISLDIVLTIFQIDAAAYNEAMRK